MAATLDDVVTELKKIKRLLKGSYIDAAKADEEMDKND